MENNLLCTPDCALVSVVVITYNSKDFIIETLESVKNQSYSKIELIISDDASSDNTIELCQNWIKDNKKLFFGSKIITIEKNTGIPTNCNRGVKNSQGKWIKLIAGDDLLISDCIQNFINFVSVNKSAEVIYSKSLGFFGDISNQNFGTYKFPGYSNFFNADVDTQFKLLLRRNYCDGPTVFFKKSTFDAIDGFNESYKFEDYPFGLKVARNKIKLYFMDLYTVHYRENIVSITRVGGNKLFSKFYIETEKFNRVEIYPNCNFFVKIAKKIEFSRLQFFDNFGLNRRNIFTRILFLTTYYLNPLHLYNKYF
jgi:alpha-1,3-rhamnosyltransferase